MPTYNVTQLYFGTYAQLDYIESNYFNNNIENEKTEDGGWRVGAVFNEKNLRLVNITQINDTHRGGKVSTLLDDDDYTPARISSPGDKVSYRLDNQNHNEIIDSTFTWEATLKTAGSPPRALKLSLIQLRNGAIFSSEDLDLDNQKIVSITLNKHIDSKFEGTVGGLSIDNARIVCFTAGTQIKTAEKERAIEDLVAGDMVLTMDMGYQPIRWIGGRKLSALDLIRFPNLRPIRIRAGALGDGYPAQDLLVSPQHRMLVRGRIPRRMFDSDEVLVAAKHLLELKGIEVADDVTEVEYFHILFDRHQVIWANGAASESLYTGREALKSLPKEQLDEIYEIFPQLRELDHENMPANDQFAPARKFVNGRLGRNMAARLSRNAHDAYLETA